MPSLQLSRGRLIPIFFTYLKVWRLQEYPNIKNELKKCKNLKGTFKGIGQFWKKEFLNTPTSVIRLYPCGRRSGTQKPQSGEILLCSGEISLKNLIRNSDPEKSGCKLLWSGAEKRCFRMTEVGVYQKLFFSNFLNVSTRKNMLFKNFHFFTEYLKKISIFLIMCNLAGYHSTSIIRCIMNLAWTFYVTGSVVPKMCWYEILYWKLYLYGYLVPKMCKYDIW